MSMTSKWGGRMKEWQYNLMIVLCATFFSIMAFYFFMGVLFGL